MEQVRRMAVILAVLAAAVFATTVPSAAHAAPARSGPTVASVSDRAATPARTRLTLAVTGCDACSLTLQHAVTGAGPVWTSATKKIGSDQQVAFRLRRSLTHGLSFVLRAPWEGDTGAVPNVVTRYAGRSIDSAVTRAMARHGRHAEGCWAGTRLGAVTLDLHVARVPGTTVTGDRTQVPLAYSRYTMSSWGPVVRTYKGTIGNQDAFYCTRPPTTRVTLRAPGCDGCALQLLNGAARPENIWISPSGKVRSGAVSFRAPTPLTRGISAVVRAPWEGSPPFTTLVVWRYGGHAVGDPVTFTEARSATRASGCWGGTGRSAVTMRLTVRKVTVTGTTGKTAGTIAFADVTRRWLPPMFGVEKGVLGTQDVLICQK